MNLGDRVKETSTSTGTGAFALAGAVSGYVTFSSVLSDGQITFYCIENGTDFEVGQGTYVSASDSLSRNEIFASTNSSAKVNWSGGTKRVFITVPADFAKRSLPLIFTAGAAISKGQLCTLNSSNEVSPASVADDLTVIGVARADAGAGSSVLIDAAPGNEYVCKFSLAPASSDVGRRVFLTGTSGEFTITPPTVSGRVFLCGTLTTSGSTLSNVLFNPRLLVELA
jgi:hypothetical protein